MKKTKKSLEPAPPSWHQGGTVDLDQGAQVDPEGKIKVDLKGLNHKPRGSVSPS